MDIHSKGMPLSNTKKKKKPKQATDTHECKMNFKNHRRVHR